MSTEGRDLVERLHREAVERMNAGLDAGVIDPPPRRVMGLPDVAPDSSITAEWDMFRREVESLIREGNKGRFAVVKAGHPITVWETLRDALQAAELLFGKEMCLVQEIQRYLPPLRLEGDRSWRD
jgi:hypothetical protein